MNGLGRVQHWTVQKVEHKYLPAHNDITENFNSRFPTQDGFWVIRTVGDDVEPVLDVMRRQGERHDKVLGLYAEGKLPIAVIVELAGRSVIAFADTLRFLNVPIDTCEGTLPERQRASAVVQEFRDQGVVLDSLTHWVAVDLEAIDILKSVFGKVVVPRSAVDELAQLGDGGGFGGGEWSGTAGYYGGKFFFDEMTAERAAARAEAIIKREESLQMDCEVGRGSGDRRAIPESRAGLTPPGPIQSPRWECPSRARGRSSAGSPARVTGLRRS